MSRHKVTDQDIRLNDCAIFTGCNAMHRILNTQQFTTQWNATIVRHRWIPAFLLSGWTVGRRAQAPPHTYPWSADDTIAAFLTWFENLDRNVSCEEGDCII